MITHPVPSIQNNSFWDGFAAYANIYEIVDGIRFTRATFETFYAVAVVYNTRPEGNRDLWGRHHFDNVVKYTQVNRGSFSRTFSLTDPWTQTNARRLTDTDAFGEELVIFEMERRSDGRIYTWINGAPQGTVVDASNLNIQWSGLGTDNFGGSVFDDIGYEYMLCTSTRDPMVYPMLRERYQN